MLASIQGWLFRTGSTGCEEIIAPERQPWVPLMLRGGCTFEQKIANAALAGAAGVIVMDNMPGDQPLVMAGTGTAMSTYQLARTLASVGISNHIGKQLQSSLPLVVEVEVQPNLDGDEHAAEGLWFLGHVMVFAFTVMLVGVLALVVYHVRSCRLRRRQRVKTKMVSKFITRLSTRTFLLPVPPVKGSAVPDTSYDRGGEDSPSCAVCLDDFVRGDLLRVLPCGHELHRACVDPWLEAHHNCPLCKDDILNSRGSSSIDLLARTNSKTGLLQNEAPPPLASLAVILEEKEPSRAGTPVLHDPVDTVV